MSRPSRRLTTQRPPEQAPACRRRSTLIGATLLALLLTGCTSSSPEATESSLIDNALWQQVPSDEDTLADHQPESATCPNSSWGLEDGALEVDTGLCNYLSLSQPALDEVVSGDTISLVAWHSSLWDAGAAEAHIAVLFGDILTWETTVAIPADPGVFDLEFSATADLIEGEAIQLHLHNHGSNAWNFLELARQL